MNLPLKTMLPELTEGQIKLLERVILEGVIGEDEKHHNGQKLVNPMVCDDCGIPEEGFTRNEHRAEMRLALRSLLYGGEKYGDSK